MRTKTPRWLGSKAGVMTQWEMGTKLWQINAFFDAIRFGDRPAVRHEHCARLERLLGVALFRQAFAPAPGTTDDAGLRAAERLADDDPYNPVDSAAEDVVEAKLRAASDPPERIWNDRPTYLRRAAMSRILTGPFGACRLGILNIIAAVEMTAPGSGVRAHQAPVVASFVGPGWLFDPAWRTSTAAALAGMMYDGRDFSPMPILADALQDAGCTADELLADLRDPAAEWYRGNRIVDELLHKRPGK